MVPLVGGKIRLSILNWGKGCKYPTLGEDGVIPTPVLTGADSKVVMSHNCFIVFLEFYG